VVGVDGSATSVRAIELAAEEAALRGADLVGARGRGGFTDLPLGSVSQHLIHRAACPVMVIRSPRR
jgi:nucleotide-binding universal stress UspA family protein